MSIISLAHLTDQTEIAYIDYTYIYIDIEYLCRYHIKSAQGFNLPSRALYRYCRLDDRPRLSP